MIEEAHPTVKVNIQQIEEKILQCQNQSQINRIKNWRTTTSIIKSGHKLKTPSNLVDKDKLYHIVKERIILKADFGQETYILKESKEVFEREKD